MKACFAIPGALLILLILTISASEPARLIPWHLHRTLVWSDFDGPPDSHIIHQNNEKPDQVKMENGQRTTIHTETDAYCYHQLSFHAEEKMDSIIFEVVNSFDPSLSWHQTNSLYILNHEQRHFDLAEVYARRFRRYLKDSVHAFNRQQQQQLFQRFLNEDKSAQDLYDQQTDHSINTSIQEAYNQRIDSMITELDVYAGVRVAIPKPKHNLHKR